MAMIDEFFRQTPWWVYVLFFYLLSRGMAARKPAEVSLPKLAIIPVLLTVWSLTELVRIYDTTLPAIAIWLAGLLIGMLIGRMLVSRMSISVNPITGVIRRPADFTLLPLVLVTFAVKYAFGVVAATDPGLLQESGFKVADLALSGLFSGIFVGKFALYVSHYLKRQASI